MYPHESINLCSSIMINLGNCSTDVIMTAMQTPHAITNQDTKQQKFGDKRMTRGILKFLKKAEVQPREPSMYFTLLIMCE